MQIVVSGIYIDVQKKSIKKVYIQKYIDLLYLTRLSAKVLLLCRY